jgi:uncharacterized protein
VAHLLDINVLVALFDAAHVNHDAGHDWFGRVGSRGWSTCPTTENGCIGVLSSPAYPTVQTTAIEVVDRLARFCALEGHLFWPDDISLTQALERDARDRFSGPQQVTDFYLAALAAHHDGQLATFDGSFARALRGTGLERAVSLLG